MRKPVRKAVIPAAGLGTRLLPATKAQPKEMLPIVDKPAIQYIVEEAVAAGIEDIIIITGRNKRAIEDHFDRNIELEMELEAKGDEKALEEVRRIAELADVHYIRQKQPRGLGHAVACAKSFVGDEPFAVLLGDDVMFSERPCIAQLIDLYRETGGAVVGVQEVPRAEVSRYGIVDPNGPGPGGVGHRARALVEKPSPEEAPSNLAIMGRYVITPEIFAILDDLPPGKGNEIQLTDGLNVLCRTQGVWAMPFEGRRFDIGNPMGLLRASVEVALMREDIGPAMEAYLEELVRKGHALGRRMYSRAADR
ncbi:UTP--glucose-1-phosphate uridylyltransferase GalU [Kyrpidia tusciae]|uniref:UTP--glucose-1-phosphate uridylyltransferase n=1 Tax=Kyrpidia tusciae (strain DSM 2912 / NBRC 15312 / T2) TaxID=562970 RepID=D5WVH0_KYRT2|nr:UTP--glucose-1-phosphate uridylyltransferase GalU [Kyrpidia tusciae]ADG05580.1 UTP-glucose-1-phosphate uridylyltransferase [Kyrpidia tusciae DSM 2912]